MYFPYNKLRNTIFKVTKILAVYRWKNEWVETIIFCGKSRWKRY